MILLVVEGAISGADDDGYIPLHRLAAQQAEHAAASHATAASDSAATPELLQHQATLPSEHAANATVAMADAAVTQPLHIRICSRGSLKSQLLLMGVKPAHAKRASLFVFGQLLQRWEQHKADDVAASATVAIQLLSGICELSTASTLVITDCALVELVHEALLRLKRYTAAYLTLWDMSRRIQEQRCSLIVMLSGTSGTGKSTLASLLADRLRLNTVIGTDTVRNALRTKHQQQSSSESGQSCDVAALHVSTYQAHAAIADETMPHNKRVRKGYRAQSRYVLEALDGVIADLIASRCSAVVEGVHLMPQHLIQLMAKHASSSNVLIIPFVIYISNPVKHSERFAVRSKYMTLDPRANKYVDSFDNIRVIQSYLLKKADQALLPTVDNTNVDRSLASIHSIILRCMRYAAAGQPLVTQSSDTVYQAASMHDDLEESQQEAWSSKQMQQRIQQKAHHRQATGAEEHKHDDPLKRAANALQAAHISKAATASHSPLSLLHTMHANGSHLLHRIANTIFGYSALDSHSFQTSTPSHSPKQQRSAEHGHGPGDLSSQKSAAKQLAKAAVAQTVRFDDSNPAQQGNAPSIHHPAGSSVSDSDSNDSGTEDEAGTRTTKLLRPSLTMRAASRSPTLTSFASLNSGMGSMNESDDDQLGEHETIGPIHEEDEDTSSDEELSNSGKHAQSSDDDDG